jgi:protein-L-isoaspartate(D-aspartate) O-methyltransferase
LESDALSERRYERARRQLIEVIADKGIHDLAVLRAFDLVSRHVFLPDSVKHRAYEDAPLPIGFGQTASQPSLQALYMQVLDLQQTDKVLEVGTGSGFQTAVLASLTSQVYSIERIRELSTRARAVLDSLRISNIALLVGDGTIGWSKYAPYDAILVAAASPSVPDALVNQLAPGGRMLIPIGDLAEQKLTLVRKTDDGIEQSDVANVTFVPLIGRFGWAN